MNVEYFESAEVSDVGRKRKNNEDACLRIPARGVFCVADGMGGQAGGDLASETIITTLQETFTKATAEEDSTLLKRVALFRRATNKASKWIKNFADEKVIGQMGSTVVALVIDPHNPRRAVGLHAGDSRLYRYRKGEFKQITADHSAVAALAAKLGIDPDKIPAKYQNELLRAVGLTELVELEKTPVDIASGDIFLICSDGLSKMLTDDAIAKIIKDGIKSQTATQAIAQTLINAANEAGGKDNVTVVLVKALDLSTAPDVLTPETPADEDEEKTFAAPAAPTLADAPTLANLLGAAAPAPESGDIHGDTPQTPTPTTKPEPPTPNKATPSAAPTAPSAAKTTPVQPGKTNAPAPAAQLAEPKKNSRAGLISVIIIAVALAAAGAWLASRPRPAATIPAPPVKPATTPAAVQPAPEKIVEPTAAPAETELAKAQAAYREVMANAQSAWEKHDFKTAAMLAATALQKIPGDAAATKLASEAQAQLKNLETGQAAFRKSQIAANNRDYKTALTWANEALKYLPNDTGASQLRDSAQQHLAATAAQEQKFQALTLEGQTALKNNNPSLAAKKAQEMLVLRPNDPAATSIIKQSQQLMDLESGHRSFDQGDYDYALQICQNNPGVEGFKLLAENCHAEQAILAEDKSRLAAGDYSFVNLRQGQPVARKTPFAELLKQASAEQKLLGELQSLQQANNWSAVTNSFANPANAAVASKPPFHALDQWATATAIQVENQKRLQQANVIFEEMLVWFNLKRAHDPYLQTSEAKKQTRLDGALTGEQRQKYLASIDWLEAAFTKGGLINQNNRAQLLKDLRAAVTRK